MRSKQKTPLPKQNRNSQTALRETLASRLAAYSTTALAALALAPAAHAQVIPITSFSYSSLTSTTTPPILTLGQNDSSLKLNFEVGPFEMSLGGYRAPKSSHTQWNGAGFIKEVSTQKRIGFADRGASSSAALKLGLGSIINQHLSHARKNGALGTRSVFNRAGYTQPFQPHANGAVTGYIGFKGTNAGHDYYGWLNVKVSADAGGLIDSITFVAASGSPGVFGAYEISTDPKIGSFSAGQSSIPEPADAAFGLGLLAFGAAGVREMRKRRKMVA